MPLIDRYMPHYQFVERHATTIRAAPARVLDIAATQSLLDTDRIVRAMLALRHGPAALARRLGLGSDTEAFGMTSFTPLGRDGDREIAAGLAGRFWRLDGGLQRFVDAAAFERFAEPGVAKLVLNFAAEPMGSGTRFTTETRVFCPDTLSRALFTPYWIAIRLGSGFIRKRFLAAIKRAAETSQTGLS